MGFRSLSRWSSHFGYFLFLVMVVAFAGEGGVRLMGYRPWMPPTQSFRVEPGGSFFQLDDRLGYKGRPGSFDLVLEDRLHFHVTHDADGHRITGPQTDTVDLRPQIWLLGCSFTHGYGVDDVDHFPWLLQEALPKWHIRNLGVDGYGTFQNLLELRALLEDSLRPVLVVLNYGAFHDQRNVNNRYWRKALAGREVADGLRFPFLRYNETGQLDTLMESPSYQPWPGQRYSALIHFLEMKSNLVEDQALRGFEITQGLIRQMAAICEEQGIPFLLTGIFKHEGTTAMLKDFQDICATLDISIDVNQRYLRILEEDRHPNAIGHQMMFEALLPEVETLLLQGK